MSDDFIQRQGPAFVAHLFRRLSDELVRGASDWYPTMGVVAPPRTTSTLLALDDHGPLGVTEIAALLRQSHPLVIGWIKQLRDLDLVASAQDPQDRRRTVITLTAAGKREVRRLRSALTHVDDMTQQLLDECGTDLMGALWRIEAACRRMPFGERLRSKPQGSGRKQTRKVKG